MVKIKSAINGPKAVNAFAKKLAAVIFKNYSETADRPVIYRQHMFLQHLIYAWNLRNHKGFQGLMNASVLISL